MLKKLTALAALLFILLAAISAFKPTQNPFPVPVAIIEQAFNAHGLSWELRETQSFAPGSEVHMVYNQNEKFTAVLNSFEVERRRELSLQFHYPRGMTTISEAIGEDDWPLAVSLLCDLYGGGANAQRVYRAFEQYLEEQHYEPKERFLQFYYQEDGVHYLFTLIPSIKYYGSFDLLSIRMMNAAFYQQFAENQKQVAQTHENQETRRGKYPWEL